MKRKITCAYLRGLSKRTRMNIFSRSRDIQVLVQKLMMPQIVSIQYKNKSQNQEYVVVVVVGKYWSHSAQTWHQ